MNDTGIPDMMDRIQHVQNRRGAVFSLALGLFGPLTALLMMHYGGQGEWHNMAFLGWAGRFVAFCCLTVSAPKVYRFFMKATAGHRVEALGATAALEIAALLAVSQVIGLYAFVLQVVINTLVYSDNIAKDQKSIHKAEREAREASTPLLAPPSETKDVPVEVKKARPAPRKRPSKGKVVNIKPVKKSARKV
jgi:hypothetical protein